MQLFRVLLIILLFSNLVFGQSGNTLDRTKLALKGGNSQILGQMMGEKVQLGFDGEAQSLGPREAEAKMDAFFKKFQVVDLLQLFQGQSKDGKQYFIGVLKTKNGDFRVSVYWVDSPKTRLLSLDFSKE